MVAVTAPVRRVAPPHVAPPPHSWSTPFAAPSEFELVKFAAWPSCNDPQYAAAVGVAARQRLCLTDGGRLKPLPWRSSNPEADLFDGDTLQNKLGRALAAVEAIDRKEFFEAFEVFAKTRSSLKAPTLVEVGGGHALLGLLFATFSREVERVIVADTRRPKAFDACLEAVGSVAPWAPQKLTYVDGLDADFLRGGGAQLLTADCAVASVHGCGSLTDAIIDAAVEAGAASLAVMPCCYAHSRAAVAAPRALRKSLGVAAAADVERTYTLERARYATTWRHIPHAITPLNRILVAKREPEGRKFN